VRRDEAEAIALAGGLPARALVAELIEQLEALTGQVGAGIEQVAALAAEVEELKRIVDRDSQNSSLPPSSDAPKSRAERRRAAREAYKRSMRKSGGQPGHQGKTRAGRAGARG